MSLIRINRHPSRRELAVFGLCWLAFFALLALGAFARSRQGSAALLAALALVVPLAGRIWPSLLRLVYVCGWSTWGWPTWRFPSAWWFPS